MEVKTKIPEITPPKPCPTPDYPSMRIGVSICVAILSLVLFIVFLVNDSMFLYTMAGAVMCLSIVYAYIFIRVALDMRKSFKTEQDAYNNFQKNHPQWKEENFYIKCYNNGIVNLETREEMARALVLAVETGVIVNRNSPNAEDAVRKALLCGEPYANKAAAQARAEREREKAERVRELRQKERERYKNSVKNQIYTGYEKPYQIYMSVVREAQKRKDKLEKESHDNTMLRKSGVLLQKEGDWAIAGGIADGIAGPAAGIAAAMDTERRNQTIRENNTAISMGLVHQMMNIQGKLTTENKTIEEYTQKAEQAKRKLVERIPADKLFAKLNLKLKSIEVSESGAVSVAAYVNGPKVKIYDSVDAVIDGYIKANLLQNGKNCGSVILTLPTEGVSKTDSYMKGYCISTTDPNAQYTVKFEPYDLWAIEA